MSIESEQQQRFDHLLSLLLEGSHSSEDIDELLEMMVQNPELKHALRQQFELDFLLTQVDRADEKEQAFLDQVMHASERETRQAEFEAKILDAIPDQGNNKPDQGYEGKGSGFFSWKSLYFSWSISGLSLAVCALFSVLFFQNMWSNKPERSDLVLAPEVESSGVAVVMNLVDNQDQFKVGQSISPGELSIDKGFMELEFYHGAQLKIAGPATLDIIDEQRVMLYQGKVMTDVPEVAIGFTIDTPNSEVIDLGTAIGVSVQQGGQAQVHVFDGLIEMVDERGEKVRLEKGGAISQGSNLASDWQLTDASSSLFSEFNEIADLTVYETNQQHEKWLAVREWAQMDPDLVAYYDFEKNNKKPRRLNNIADSTLASNGAIVGAQWTEGPWRGKSALDFKRSSDRVRVNIGGEFDQFTLASWIKIDSLDRMFNSILLADGYNKGDIHWQLGRYENNNFGVIVLGLKHEQKEGRNYGYQPFFSVAESGTWYHLATTVDQNSREVKTYINGKLVKKFYLKKLTDFWQIGEASIGNWDNEFRKSPLRNLNGSIAELMVFSRALTEKEIAKVAVQ